MLITCEQGCWCAHTDFLPVARDTAESRQCAALSDDEKVILSIPAVNLQPHSDHCPAMPQSPNGGADTSNFDIYAKNGDDGEWGLVGRPSWRSDALNYQDLKNPRYDTHGTSFFMPKDQELTLFEPAVTRLFPPFPGPLFFYGLAVLLFGIMGFFRLNNWAGVSLATACVVALARENNIGNFENPNAQRTVLCQNHFVLMRSVISFKSDDDDAHATYILKYMYVQVFKRCMRLWITKYTSTSSCVGWVGDYSSSSPRPCPP